MSFAAAIASGFRKYITFRGTARLSEYWWWQLFSSLVTGLPMMGLIISGVAVLVATTQHSRASLAVAIVGVVVSMGFLFALSCALLLPSVSLTVRRIRDAGWSPYWVLLMAVESFVLIPIGVILIRAWGDMQTGNMDAILGMGTDITRWSGVTSLASLWLLILTLLPTKTAEAGNKYL